MARSGVPGALPRARWEHASVTSRDAAAASVHVLGAACAVTPEGSTIDVPSASHRRLLGLLAVHAPRQLRAQWLADVLDVTPGALRRRFRAFARPSGRPRCARRAG